MDFPLASTTGNTFGAINLVGLLLYTDFFTLFGKNAHKETPTKNLLKFDDFKVWYKRADVPVNQYGQTTLLLL